MEQYEYRLEELLEELYWEFDDARSKGKDERLTFKSKLRWLLSFAEEHTLVRD